MNNLEQLLKNEAFVNEMTQKESVEEIVALFAEKDVVIGADDVATMLKMITAGAQNEEVTEADLDKVSGGKGGTSVWGVFTFVWNFAQTYGPKIAGWAEKT